MSTRPPLPSPLLAHSRPIQVLLVEDNSADAYLFREAVRDCPAPFQLHTAPDGVEAIAFLARQGGYHSAPRPDLIVLDLNMPRKNGHEVLATIKANPALRLIPVVVLTTSASPKDIAAAYQLQASCYLQKPTALDEYLHRVGRLMQFWLRTATLPFSSQDARAMHG